MPITVQLQTERGEILAIGGESYSGELTLPDLEDESFPMMRYVDPHGNTVFNRLQMPALIGDLQELAGRTRTIGQRRAIQSVIDLARRCEAGVDLYLKFSGD